MAPTHKTFTPETRLKLSTGEAVLLLKTWFRRDPTIDNGLSSRTAAWLLNRGNAVVAVHEQPWLAQQITDPSDIISVLTSNPLTSITVDAQEILARSLPKGCVSDVIRGLPEGIDSIVLPTARKILFNVLHDGPLLD